MDERVPISINDSDCERTPIVRIENAELETRNKRPMQRESSESELGRRVRQPVQYQAINNGNIESDDHTSAVLSRYKYYSRLAPHSDSSFQMPDHIVPTNFYSVIPTVAEGKQSSLITMCTVKQLFQDHQVSDEAQASITLIQLAQEKQRKSATSSERKDRILNHLFFRRNEMETKLNLFRGLLDLFSDFVKSFQSESPLIHTLHSRMVSMVRQFLVMFIKPECIPEHISNLVKLDVADREIQKVDKDLGVGKFAFLNMNKARLDKTCKHWTKELYTNLRTGYIQAAKKMLQMPLTNNTLRLCSVLDPHFVGHQQTTTSIKKLATSISSFTTNAVKMGQLVEESARYNVDSDVKLLASAYDNKEPVDTAFWGKVFKLESFNKPRYPALKTLVSSLLTVFSGPLVESSFNIMDDIVEKDRASLTIENYEAITIVKTHLRKTNVKSTNLEVNSKMKISCINAYSTYKKHLQKKKELKELEMQEKLSKSVQLLEVEKAKRAIRFKRKITSCKGTILASRKRKCELESSGKETWKRVKVNL